MSQEAVDVLFVPQAADYFIGYVIVEFLHGFLNENIIKLLSCLISLQFYCFLYPHGRESDFGVGTA